MTTALDHAAAALNTLGHSLADQADLLAIMSQAAAFTPGMGADHAEALNIARVLVATAGIFIGNVANGNPEVIASDRVLIKITLRLVAEFLANQARADVGPATMPAAEG